MSLNRRGLITGIISLVAAPAIIRVNHLMPISVQLRPYHVNLMVDNGEYVSFTVNSLMRYNELMTYYKSIYQGYSYTLDIYPEV